jgi:hypothetical protein
MYNTKPVWKIVFFLLVVSLCTTPAWPQASTGTVSGTVRDSTGGVIPGASVTLTNADTNLESKSFTNAVGFYMFGNARPGPYRMTVEFPGMQKYEATLTVQVAQSAVVNVEMRVGQTAVEVTVTDVTPMMTTDSPTLGHVLERSRIEQLPINGRSLRSLLQTVPGMEGTRAYGLREGSHEFVLDGAPISLWNYGGTITRLPGLDTIQEFKVENNNSSAKFTRPTNVVIATKSGSNLLHGNAFWTHRNADLGLARRRQDPTSLAPHLIRNEFGANAGAPVYIPGVYNGKNRTFWFFAYEGSRHVEGDTGDWPVPTEAMRNGDFRELIDSQGRELKLYDPWSTNPVTWERQQFSHNGQLNVINPALLSPLAKALFDITPMPTEANINPNLDDNWYGPEPFVRRDWTVTTRFDHRFTDNDQFYVRYSQGDYFQHSQFYSQPMLNGVAGTVKRFAPNKSGVISWVHTFSPTFFNEWLGSVSREYWWKGTGEPGAKYADDLGLPNPFNVIGWPGLYSTGLYNDDYYFETDNTQASPFLFGVIDDNATKIAGRHELQFGVHYRWDQLNLLPDQQQPQGNHSWSTGATSLYDTTSSRTNPTAELRTGHNMGNMFIGSMNYSNQLVRGYFYTRAKEISLYFQDNFKVTPRLTLNLGLRYEYWPALREKNNILTGFDPASRSIILGQDLQTMYDLGATFPAVVEQFQSLGVKFISYQEAGRSQNLTTAPKANPGWALPTGWATAPGRSCCGAATGSPISASRRGPGRRPCARTLR